MNFYEFHPKGWRAAQERHLTNLPLKGNGTQERHSRRTKRLTMLCRMQVRNRERFIERKNVSIPLWRIMITNVDGQETFIRLP